MPHTLIDTINRTYVETHPEKDKPFRAHLGGSMIGKKCERELFYSFRWFKRPTFDGRMLRLFNRGHKEEFRFVEYLRMIGIEVFENAQALFYHAVSQQYEAIPWDDEAAIGEAQSNPHYEDVTGDESHTARAKAQGVEVKQWRISDVMGHFGGSLDGIAVAPFDIQVVEYVETSPEKWAMRYTERVIPAGEKFLNEFKTHNTKSFVNLVTEGVKRAKPVHWAQMQIYMHKRGLRFAIYMAVNKNDDDLHLETVEYAGPEAAQELLDKATRVIHTRKVPNRIGKHASWYDCKFCEYSAICHYGDTSAVDRNCRTCQHSVPVDGGQWHCEKWNATIPSDAILKGCDSHKLITD